MAGNECNFINNIKTKDIICPQCKELSKMKIENYRLTFYNCKNSHYVSDILLDDYFKSQYLENIEIKCDICNKKCFINNYFYNCYNCKLYLCQNCKLIHEQSHNIIFLFDKNNIILNLNKNNSIDNKQNTNKEKNNLKIILDKLNKNIKDILSKLKIWKFFINFIS